MKRSKNSFFACLAITLALSIVSVAWSEKAAIPLTENTITRTFDHVVVLGKDLKENLNKPISQMRLFALKDGKMQPIPFQIDEVTDDGYWVLPNKSPYLDKKTASKAVLIQDEPPEVMDENDQMAFMITDIGDRVAPSFWPAGWLYADEITLTDPLTNDHGWAYLFSFTNSPDPSPVDYVEYRLPEDKKDKIITGNYRLGFSHEVSITPDHLDFGDGVNCLDRMKSRMYFRFFGIFTFDRNENDIKSMMWQYKDGSVRAVRMVRSSIRLIGNIQSPQLNSETLYYGNATVLPMQVKLPKMPKGIVNEAFVDSGGDWRKFYGWKARLNTDENWLSIDGKMDEVEKNIKTEGARWFILKGPGRAMIMFLNFLEDYGNGTEFHYLDDAVTEHPPEFHPGQVPLIGYRIRDLQKASGWEKWEIRVITFYINEEYTEKELLGALNIFDNPIQIKTRGFNSTNQDVVKK